MFKTKQYLDNETEAEFKARRKAIRNEDAKDTLTKAAASIAPAAILIGGLIIMGTVSSKRSEAKNNEKEDLLAKGLGYSGRKDPAYAVYKHNEHNTLLTSNDDSEDDEEFEEDEE